jgi:hypothetical protein
MPRAFPGVFRCDGVAVALKRGAAQPDREGLRDLRVVPAPLGAPGRDGRRPQRWPDDKPDSPSCARCASECACSNRRTTSCEVPPPTGASIPSQSEVLAGP